MPIKASQKSTAAKTAKDAQKNAEKPEVDMKASDGAVAPKEPEATPKESEAAAVLAPSDPHIPPAHQPVYDFFGTTGFSEYTTVSPQANAENTLVVSSTGVASRTLHCVGQGLQDAWYGNFEAWGEICGMLAAYVGIYGFLLSIAFMVVQVQTSDTPDDRLPDRWVIYTSLGLFAGFTCLEGLLKFWSSASDSTVGHTLVALYGRLLNILEHRNIKAPHVILNESEYISDFVLYICGFGFIAIGIYGMSQDIFGLGFTFWALGSLGIKFGFLGKADGHRVVIANYFRFVRSQVKQHKTDTRNQQEENIYRKIISDLEQISGRIPAPFQVHRQRMLQLQ